jgi:hypothetical protein
VSDIREQLIKLGWRQGSIIEAGAIEHEVFANQAGADAFLVLNQTCDVLNPSWDKEPFVEILPLSLIKKPNSAFLNGRNPRQIHFAANVGGSECFLEAFAPRTLTIPHQLLLTSAPSTSWILDEPALKSLIAWRAARYLRTAFPDDFENRLKSIFGGFKSLIESIHTHLIALHVRVEPFGPLLGDDPYEVDLMLLVRRKSHDDKETRDNLIASGKNVETLINSADGLVCTSCKVRAPHEVTLEEIDGYLRWERHDYLSFGEDE